MLFSSIYLAFSFWLCLLMITRDVRWYWTLGFCLTIIILVHFDTLLISFPLLVGLLSYKSSFVKEKSRLSLSFRWACLAVVFSAIGLLTLVKGSMLLICMSIMALCLVFFFLQKHVVPAFVSLFAPLGSVVLLWIASGQWLPDLPSYFKGILLVSSGYSEAMATSGNTYEIALFILAALLILLLAFLQNGISWHSRLFLFLLFSSFLFLSFKAGFVRHDMHAILSANSVLIASLCLPMILHNRFTFPVILCSIFFWYLIHVNYYPLNINILMNNTWSPYIKAYKGIHKRLTNKDWLRSRYATRLDSLAKKSSFPRLAGTSDIYSSSQSSLIASGNNWSPRPVFQSYAAFNPRLAAMNRDHLLGNKAPDHVFFGMEPIDGRLPSLEDGVSWPVLLNLYRPLMMNDSLLVLDRVRDMAAEPPLDPVFDRRFDTGEPVALPDTGSVLFAQVIVELGIFGRLADFFYKPGSLRITLVLNDGNIKEFRFVAGMAASGFVLSPLIENPHEFYLLYVDPGSLVNKTVRSMTVVPEDPDDLSWEKNYRVIISRLPVRKADPRQVRNFSEEKPDLTTFEVKK